MSDWTTKYKMRSVAQLKLWNKNPRLDPNQTYVQTHSFAEGVCNAAVGDKDAFMALVESIVKQGFLSIDPVVVWQNPNDGRFYVAEGNRRVLALKLLISPNSAPASIRSKIQRLAKKDDFKTKYKTIPVLIAPSLEAVRWYIAQRHNSATSLQKGWNREQQYRYVADYYASSKDIQQVASTLGMTAADILDMVRFTHLKEYIIAMPNVFSPAEREAISAPKFPLSTLERFVNYQTIRERLKLRVDGEDFKSSLPEKEFNRCLSVLIKLILSEEITSRSSDAEVLKKLPEPSSFSPQAAWRVVPPSNPPSKVTVQTASPAQSVSTTVPVLQKDNHKRKNLVPQNYSIGIQVTRIVKLFEELKKLSLPLYPNIAAASLRVLLDLSVHAYLERNSYFDDLKRKYKTSEEKIQLKSRLEFLKSEKILPNNLQKIISKLLEPNNELSLDVLNGYIHSSSTVFIDQSFLNRFFDFIYPLLAELDNIQEATP